MLNFNFKSIIVLILPLLVISCGKSTIESRQAENRAYMSSLALGSPPEYTYSTYYDNPKYFVELKEFWHASRNIESWDSINIVGQNMIHRYDQMDTLSMEAKRSVMEYISFELFKEFLVDDKNEYAKNREKSLAILYYLKKLREYDSNNNPGKFLKILDNIKPHINKKEYKSLVKYYRST